MAHFAEIDSNNIVLRVVVIDNNDVNASGGDQSVGAEEKVKSIVPFTSGTDGFKLRIIIISENNMLELVIRLMLLKINLYRHNLLHLGHLMLMTTGKHLLHIQQLQPTEIMLNTLFRGMKLDKDGLVKTIKTTNSLGHLTLPLGLLQATKEF
jgi:hypothetical protein